MRWNALVSERNVQDKMAGGQTSLDKRFGKVSDKPIIPFGASAEYLPSPPTTCPGHISSVKKSTLEGIFIEYVP